MASRKLAAFRLDDDLLQGLRVVWERDGVQPSEQVRRAVRQWLEGKGVRARAVNIRIESVDHASDDLYRQTPLRGRVLRRIAKHDRSDRFRTASGDYWLAELGTPLSWTTDDVTRTIRHLVLAARWEGTSIQPGTTLPVGIAYVVDESLLSSESFDFTQAEYVAIGMARISGPPFWSKVWTRLVRRRAFPRNRLSRAQDPEGRLIRALATIPRSRLASKWSRRASCLVSPGRRCAHGSFATVTRDKRRSGDQRLRRR